jgi:Domain of unknown function (DUF4249)
MNKIISCSRMLMLIVVLNACSKNDGSSYEAKAVVEAYLQPGQKASVNITREILAGESGSGNLTISGLSVIVKHNGTNYTLTQNASGVYENASLPIIAGDSYELSFNYNNTTITATTTVPDKPTNFACTPLTLTIPAFGGGMGGPPSIPEPLKATWDNLNGDYHLLAIKSVDAGATEISTAGPGGQGAGFTNSPDQANNKDINFRAFTYYGRNALILYRIQPELAVLYNSGGSNSQNLTTVPSNVNNGLGIFTAVNIADTVFVTVN